MSLSCLSHLGQLLLGRSAEEALVKFRDPLEGVDLPDRLVVADAHDARKTQRVAARVPARVLNRVEGDLEHDFGSHDPGPAAIFDGHTEKPLRHLGDLGIGEPGIRLAYIYEPAHGRVLDRERVVGKYALSLAVSPLARGHHDIDGCQRTLELQPRKPATPRGVRASWA